MITIVSRITAKQTTDGAGVPLNRVFGYYDTPIFDPFLMCDYFYSEDTEEVAMGFPWHPHRGIETITYIKKGSIEHEDSLGNKGLIGPGDVQWMTAGSGIIHQEMPQSSDDGIEGFQFWLNMSSDDKMTKPQYGDLKNEDIPVVDLGEARVKVIAGKIGHIVGPITREKLDITLKDVHIKSGGVFFKDKESIHNLFIFLYRGRVKIENEEILPLTALQLSGEGKVKVEALESSDFIIGMGRTLNEPIAWRGPIVMNTMEEIKQAFDEIDKGTFIKR
jgi:hypothetical protein